MGKAGGVISYVVLDFRIGSAFIQNEIQTAPHARIAACYAGGRRFDCRMKADIGSYTFSTCIIVLIDVKLNDTRRLGGRYFLSSAL